MTVARTRIYELEVIIHKACGRRGHVACLHRESRCGQPRTGGVTVEGGRGFQQCLPLGLREPAIVARVQARKVARTL